MKLTEQTEDDKKGLKYEYGCVMLYYDFTAMFKIQDAVNPKDWYEDENDDSYGMEYEPHVTLLFGLHDGVTVDQVKEILDKYTFGNCIADHPSLFLGNVCDVFKFDVTDNTLNECNAELLTLPNSNEFPVYHPHMTIGYLLPNKGQRYIEMLEDCNGDKHKVKPKYAVYSMTNGDKIEIPIKFG